MPISITDAPAVRNRAHLSTSRLDLGRILAIAHSPRAEAGALAAAAQVARWYGSRVSMLLTTPEPIRHGIMGAADEQIARADRAAAEARWEALAANPSREGITVEPIFAAGAPGPLIRQAIADHDLRLVVTTRHLPGLELLLRTLAVPVLVIAPEAAFPAALQTILLATGLGPQALRPAQFAASIAEEMQADLVLLHVVTGLDGLPEDARAEVSAQIKAGLDALVPLDAGLWCLPRLEVRYGPPAHAILELAAELQPELMVMGAHQGKGAALSHLPWTVLGHILEQAPCPVLVLPEAPAAAAANLG